MGQSIDIHIYELQPLKEALNKRGAHGELLDKILAKCGTIAGDKYVLLNNEVWDGYSPYYNLSALIDSAFNIEDSFDDILGYGNPYHTEGVNSVDAEEVAEVMGFQLKEEEYMEFPVYRKKNSDGMYRTYLLMPSIDQAHTITIWHNGDYEIEFDGRADFDLCMKNFPYPSTPTEFTAAYEAVQLKITNAVNTK